MVFDGLHWYWQPSTFAGCFIFALISLACWGSWSNTAKASSHIPFAVYYLDFSIALFAVAAFAFLSVGGLVFNDGQVDSSPQEPAGCSLKVFAAVGAGTLFNVANVLLVIGIQLAGLAVAFPVGIGLALVLGTLLTFLIDPHGNSPGPLFTGVALAFLAILCQVKAKLALDEDLRTEKTPTIVGSVREAARAPADDSTRLVEPQAASGMSKQQKALAVCVACGLLMSLWSPLSAYAMSTNSNGEDGYAGLWECSLTPYSTYLLFTAAALASSLLICKLLMDRPLVGERSSFTDWTKLTRRDHGYGLAGGAICAVGTLCNLLAGEQIGMALSYAVGQAAPMVATLWGLFYYHEFRGAPKQAMQFVGLMFVLYIGAILLIASSK